MVLALAMALQAAAAAPLAARIDFDLAKYRPAERGCGEADGAEIVICGRRRAEPNLKMDPRWVDKPVRAEIGLGGGATLRAYGESVEMPGGQISKRGMIGIRLPF
jgi:hypothetical protein